jgi:hypothetical protein
MSKLNLHDTFRIVKSAVDAGKLQVVGSNRFPGDTFKHVTYPGITVEGGDLRPIMCRLVLEAHGRKIGIEGTIDNETFYDASIAYVRLHVKGGVND